jgi:hypothetical protein
VFDVQATDHLTVLVAWSDVSSGDHVQQLSFRLPNGDVYLVQAKQIFGGAPSTEKLTIPVTGTAIQNRSLTGNWTVEVRLDNVLVRTAGFQFVLPSSSTANSASASSK